MPIRRTPLPDDNKQVNIRLGVEEIEEAERIAEAEDVDRTVVLRSLVRDGLDTYETEGRLLPPEIMDRVREAAQADGIGELQALRQAVECWLRTTEELAAATAPRRFPPREVQLANQRTREFCEKMLGKEGR